MLILRLKRCERALAGGRLDEAMRLLLPADARAHRRGQELLDRLVAALVERGRGHLAEGRHYAADADCQAAAGLAGNTPAVARLRASLDQASADRQRASDERRRARSAVEAFMRQGQFTLAGHVAQAAVDPAAGGGARMTDIALTRAALERLTSDVAAALARGDWEVAIRRLGAAGPAFGAEARLSELKRQVAARVADDISRLIDAGCLDEAASVLGRTTALGPSVAELEPSRRSLDQCRLAWQHVRAARFREAREVLERLSTARPAARWITDASDELRRACESIEAVRGGTLGILDAGDATVAYPATAAVLAPAAGAAAIPGRQPARAIACIGGPPQSSPRRFLLHVDGAGSYIVLRGSRFEVGPVSASRPPDVPLIVAAGSPTLTVSRCDDDYFVSAAATPVTVNDRTAPSKLLAAGDRIAFGPRGRIEFLRPNAASGTAVLRVSGARLPWGGVREVLLMDREVVLGAAAAAHVRVRESPSPVILQSAPDGGLLCRAEQTIVVDGQPSGRATDVHDGARVTVGAVSFVVRRE